MATLHFLCNNGFNMGMLQVNNLASCLLFRQCSGFAISVFQYLLVMGVMVHELHMKK